MKKNDLLFVYGTLRRGASSDLSSNDGVSFLQRDHINGKIYRLGWYPGAIASPSHFCPGRPSIVGDLFRILSEDVPPQLDAYEGYPDLYNRIETETASGHHVWVYTYNYGVKDSDLIVSGDWFKEMGKEEPRLNLDERNQT